MNIRYKSRKIEIICTSQRVAKKKHGEQMAEIIQQRMQEIEGSPSVEFLIQYNIGRCHPLKGNRQNQYAVDLIHPFRLVFEITQQGEIQIVKIIEVINYH